LSGSEKSFLVRLGGVAGIIAPLLTFTSIGWAIATYPEFSWFDNALSDLGVVLGITATVFNSGLFIGGLLSFGFSVGLYRFLDNHAIGKVGAIIFAAASLSLVGIGVAPENVRPFHYIFSVAFFTLVPISLLVIAGYFLTARGKALAGFTLLIAVFAAAMWVLYFIVQYAEGVAIPEFMSALAGAVWTVVIGWKMFRTPSQPRNP
jgi:hypothetical membrane protein